MLYQADRLHVELHPDGIATLCFNANHSSVNTLDSQALEQLNEALNALEHAANVRALMLTSSKPSFIVGADIKAFPQLFKQSAIELDKWLSATHGIFNRLEDINYPTLALINGFALGGGFELALCCDYRLATDDAQVGLPETSLGIMPGFGGCVRLPRLIGLDNALKWIKQAKPYNAHYALEQGAIDAISTQPNAEHSARLMLKQALDGAFDYVARRQSKQLPLSLNKHELQLSLQHWQSCLQVSNDNAFASAFRCIKASTQLDRANALDIERQYFIELAQSSYASALTRLFLTQQSLKKKHDANTPITQAGVVGAGIMGGGIAACCANKKLSTTLVDINAQALEHGINEAAKQLQHYGQNAKLNSEQLSKRLSCLRPSSHLINLQNAQAVIEAVVENTDVKQQVLQHIEQHIATDALLVSNTSTIPISQLAKHLQHPARFCGMHFFNPVHRMPLVEVIRGKQSSEHSIHRVCDLTRQLGKTPIVVNDCPGFFVNRVLFPYLFAFCQLVNEGVNYQLIDEIMEQHFGWPMGPAQLLDVIGLDTVQHAGEVMIDHYSERMHSDDLSPIKRLLTAQRLGQKNGGGFYDYQSNSKGRLLKQSSPLAMAVLETHRHSDPHTVVNRLMHPLINETLRCFEENIIESPEQADLALVYGLGFPQKHGGVFHYLQQQGLKAHRSTNEKLSDLGPLYRLDAIPRTIQALT